MARYTGPRTRISRRFGIPMFGPDKYLERRNYGPGVHGPKSRRKHTEYGLGLIEKQKLRYFYGLMERQFRGVYERALKRRGVTGEQMLQILETRLDNVVFHLGFGNTRAAARSQAMRLLKDERWAYFIDWEIMGAEGGCSLQMLNPFDSGLREAQAWVNALCGTAEKPPPRGKLA